ncbi:DNA (cytosine-5-)-methyltransferase [Cyanothece sp. BG0011]|uniref:DNA (cytosine-5-)-methyltransferase n=1 Tax=Cyanothece sp. BG0011 TaxID=2082950 RepID=UPI000D1EB416|nr:DNA (cytosine-5-)-methyltransferase [Cyanothece sp. BG0011]
MINFIDIFAGIGGMRLGLELACQQLKIKTHCILSSEIDHKACETYNLNFNEFPKGDIKNIDKIEYFNFLLAGFPCQPFSYAGKHQGFGDTRGTLFFEVEKILKKYQPDGFLLENVRGLVTHDKGRTLKTIISKLNDLDYGIEYLLLNSSNFNVPQNRVRIYILGKKGSKPKLTIQSDKGAIDSHSFKKNAIQGNLFSPIHHPIKPLTVKDILEDKVQEKYFCSQDFTNLLNRAVKENFNKLHGTRLIDFRGGNSLHSWDLGIKGECTNAERNLMNLLIANRRKKVFGTHQDGKSLTLEQIKTFYFNDDLETLITSLLAKGYLKEESGKYGPVCGNLSFEVFKFLDPDSISITLTSADAHRLGIVTNNKPRRLTPRECARLQGFPDSFKLHPDDRATYKQLGNSVSVPVVEAVMIDYFKNNLN